MHYVYKYALQEDSLLSVSKVIFEERTFYWTQFLVGRAGRLYMNSAEGKPTDELWTERLSSCATSLTQESHAVQPHANTSMTATITTALTHTQVTNALNSPVQAVDLAQNEKITNQVDLSSNTAVILSNDVTETSES